MRKKLVAGNWKMHGSLQQNAALMERICAGISNVACDVAVCPPFPYLSQVRALLASTGIALGGQSVSEHAQGAYTGEVAAGMLVELGCRYVLVGHSERRSLFGETNEQVAAKFGAAQRAGLIPVLCVGETLVERQSGLAESIVAGQISAVLDRLGAAAFESAVVAYEPVWAIGTGITASPTQAQEMHRLIRVQIAAADALVGQNLRILYGGSVKPQNAKDLFEQADIDGGLIGGAALVADDFLAICRMAS